MQDWLKMTAADLGRGIESGQIDRRSCHGRSPGRVFARQGGA